MKRRHFIGLVATGAGAFICRPTARGDAAAFRAALARPRLLDLLRDDAMVRNLGQRYREIAPAEDDPRVLADAILAEARTTAFADVDAQVNDQVHRDFADGRIVTLDGWVLSVTEARQCALFSLLPG